jgi:hypothetical protein
MCIKRGSPLLVNIIPNYVVNFIHNVLFFSTWWSATAVQNSARRFLRTISRLVSADFSPAIIDLFINSFGVNHSIWSKLSGTPPVKCR